MSRKNLCILNKDNKKVIKKRLYFLKMLSILSFFTNEMECERGKQDFNNKVIVPNETSALIIQ